MAWKKRSYSHVIHKCWECTRLRGGMGKHICTWVLFFSPLLVCKCKVHLTWYALKRNPEEMSCLHFDCQTAWQICFLLQNAKVLSRYLLTFPFIGNGCYRLDTISVIRFIFFIYLFFYCVAPEGFSRQGATNIVHIRRCSIGFSPLTHDQTQPPGGV